MQKRKFYCMIMEMYNDTNNVVSKKVFYNLIEVQKPDGYLGEGKTNSIYIWFGVVLVVLVICVLFVFYQRRKLNDTQEKLDVEMSDVRNVANT